MNFETAKSLRRLKPQRRSAPLKRRPDANLPFADKASPAGRELLLDTCVYLDVLQGRTPAYVDTLLQSRIVNHSAVALGELTHRFGRLDPTDPRTRSALAEIRNILDDIPPHRLTSPSMRAFGEAGMLAGLTARLAGAGGRPDLLNDALLYLQARESGRVLLTGNLTDFDFFDQLLPGNHLLVYR